MKIVLVEYCAEWPQKFAAEKWRIRQTVPFTAIIEHIGSTAVPNLVAKPIIDIMVGLPNFDEADILVSKIRSLAYEYVSQFEDQMPFRRYFRRQSLGIRTHQIHMVALNGEFWKRHLWFRDYLRAHSDVAAEYAVLKCALAQREWDDVNDYAAAKTEFIRSVEAKMPDD